MGVWDLENRSNNDFFANLSKYPKIFSSNNQVVRVVAVAVAVVVAVIVVLVVAVVVVVVSDSLEVVVIVVLVVAVVVVEAGVAVAVVADQTKPEKNWFDWNLYTL